MAKRNDRGAGATYEATMIGPPLAGVMAGDDGQDLALVRRLAVAGGYPGYDPAGSNAMPFGKGTGEVDLPPEGTQTWGE